MRGRRRRRKLGGAAVAFTDARADQDGSDLDPLSEPHRGTHHRAIAHADGRTYPDERAGDPAHLDGGTDPQAEPDRGPHDPYDVEHHERAGSDGLDRSGTDLVVQRGGAVGNRSGG
jgi:hypothetical protein